MIMLLYFFNNNYVRLYGMAKIQLINAFLLNT